MVAKDVVGCGVREEGAERGERVSSFDDGGLCGSYGGRDLPGAVEGFFGLVGELVVRLVLEVLSHSWEIDDNGNIVLLQDTIEVLARWKLGKVRVVLLWVADA